MDTLQCILFHSESRFLGPGDLFLYAKIPKGSILFFCNMFSPSHYRFCNEDVYLNLLFLHVSTINKAIFFIVSFFFLQNNAVFFFILTYVEIMRIYQTRKALWIIVSFLCDAATGALTPTHSGIQHFQQHFPQMTAKHSNIL